jgi:hypothetical protein
MRPRYLLVVLLVALCVALGVGAALAVPSAHADTASPSPSASLPPSPSPSGSPSASPAIALASPDLVGWSRHWARMAGRDRTRLAVLRHELGRRAPRTLPVRPAGSAAAAWCVYGRSCRTLAHRWTDQRRRLLHLLRCPVALGRVLAAAHGWTGAQWRALYRLWSNESGWCVTKWNYAGSGAYGIPQALPGSKMGPGWLHSALVQIRWGIGYIRGRYGSPIAALAYSHAHGGY